MNRTCLSIALFAALISLPGCGGPKKKTGSVATSYADLGKKADTSSDGRKCASDLDGYGYCSSSKEISFCKGTSWVVLDCNSAAQEEQGGDGTCKEDDKTVDCKFEGGEGEEGGE